MLPRRFLLFGLNKIYNINPEVICTSMPYRLAARFVGCCGSEDGIYCGGISRKFVLFTLTPQRRSHTVYVKYPTISYRTPPVFAHVYTLYSVCY